jgi:hypothetical protein
MSGKDTVKAGNLSIAVASEARLFGELVLLKSSEDRGSDGNGTAKGRRPEQRKDWYRKRLGDITKRKRLRPRDEASQKGRR